MFFFNIRWARYFLVEVRAFTLVVLKILCLVTVFVFYFQKLVFENIKKKQFSYIFEIKNMFG